MGIGVWWARAVNAMRAQAVVEFLTTYLWAILIIIVVFSLLAYFALVPKSTVPTTCIFTNGVLCEDMVLAPDPAGGTSVFLNLTNIGRYAILDPTLVLDLNQINSTPFVCTPAFVPAGGSIFCKATVPVITRFDQFVAGGLYLNYSDCGLSADYLSSKNCSTTTVSTIVGKYTGHAESYFVLNNASTFSPPAYVFCIGNQSFYSPSGFNGTLGNWIKTTNYPIALTDAGCSIWQGYAYCVGSSQGGGNATNRTYYAQLSKSGVGNWIATTPYPLPMEDAGCSVWAGYIYCIGTGAAAPYNQTYYASLTNKGIGQWRATTPYPDGQSGVSCNIYNGYIYCVERSLGGNPKHSFYAHLTASGIGSWSKGPDFPQAMGNDGCTATRGTLYCIGTNRNKPSFYANISKSGALGNFTAMAPYPIKFYYGGCTTFGGYIYCVGDFFRQSNRNLVYYAALTTNGTGPWLPAPDFPVQLNHQYCTTSDSSGGYYG